MVVKGRRLTCGLVVRLKCCATDSFLCRGFSLLLRRLLLPLPIPVAPFFCCRLPRASRLLTCRVFK